MVMVILVVQSQSIPITSYWIRIGRELPVEWSRGVKKLTWGSFGCCGLWNRTWCSEHSQFWPHRRGDLPCCCTSPPIRSMSAAASYNGRTCTQQNGGVTSCMGVGIDVLSGCSRLQQPAYIWIQLRRGLVFFWHPIKNSKQVTHYSVNGLWFNK